MPLRLYIAEPKATWSDTTAPVPEEKLKSVWSSFLVPYLLSQLSHPAGIPVASGLGLTLMPDPRFRKMDFIGVSELGTSLTSVLTTVALKRKRHREKLVIVNWLSYLSDLGKGTMTLKHRLVLPSASVAREMDFRLALDPILSQSSDPLLVPVLAPILVPATSLVPVSSITRPAHCCTRQIQV